MMKNVSQLPIFFLCFLFGFPQLAQGQAQADRFDTPFLFNELSKSQMTAQAAIILERQFETMEDKKMSDYEMLPVLSALALLKHSAPLFKRSIAVHEKTGDTKSTDYKTLVRGYIQTLDHSEQKTAQALIAKLMLISSDWEISHDLDFALVESYSNEGKFELAEQLMLKTIKQNEQKRCCFPTEYLGAGRWYLEQGRFDEAKVWLSKADEKAKSENDEEALFKIHLAFKDLNQIIQSKSNGAVYPVKQQAFAKESRKS